MIGARSDRRGGATDRAAAQEAFRRRHGFHHDRAGMHRRTRRFRRAQSRMSPRSPSAPCAARSPSSRLCASASRCSRACRSSAVEKVIAERITLTPGARTLVRHHAQARRADLPRLRRLHAVHQTRRRHDRLRGKPRQHAGVAKDGTFEGVRGRADPRPRGKARDACSTSPRGSASALEETMSVGDGANDLAMIEMSGSRRRLSRQARDRRGRACAHRPRRSHRAALHAGVSAGRSSSRSS